MNLKIFPLSIFIAFFIFLQLFTFSQVKITGPECVITGTEYQYNFYGNWTNETEISVCVNGGVISPTNSNCFKGKNFNSVRVTWNDDVAKGEIIFVAGADSTSLTAKSTKVLQGGRIDSSSTMQALPASITMPTIFCSEPKGGSCSPVYSYQWEQSNDNLRWTVIPNAVLQNLFLEKSPENSVYYRRKTFESASNSIAYSDVAIVIITTNPATNQ